MELFRLQMMRVRWRLVKPMNESYVFQFYIFFPIFDLI